MLRVRHNSNPPAETLGAAAGKMPMLQRSAWETGGRQRHQAVSVPSICRCRRSAFVFEWLGSWESLGRLDQWQYAS